jgi:hypothetical protein
MELTGEGASVYAEAKGEYTRQLCQYLVPAIQKYFLEMLDHAKEIEPEPKKQLLQYQTLLESISEWNVDKVQRETQRILISTQCDYIEELLTAVFIAHTKVLSAIRLTNKQKKLQITIPKLEHFLHRTLTECARLLWTNTFLFSSSYSPLERQKNMRQIEGLISEGVLQGVRTMLPVKSILREYLATEESESESEYETESEEEETEPVKNEIVQPSILPQKAAIIEPSFDTVEPPQASSTELVIPNSTPFIPEPSEELSVPEPEAIVESPAIPIARSRPSTPALGPSTAPVSLPTMPSRPTTPVLAPILPSRPTTPKPAPPVEQEDLLFVDTDDIGFEDVPALKAIKDDLDIEFEEIA